MTEPKKPNRAFRLTLILEADTREDLVAALIQKASEVENDRLTKGMSGSPHVGSIYELLHDPTMTHEKYFQEVRTYLDAVNAGEKHDAETAAQSPLVQGRGPE